MNQYDMDKKRLQMYLPQLRGSAGLTTEDLAKRLGISKQAINNIEHQDPENRPINKMQYICLRAIFDEEYHNNPNNINLRDCYDLVFSDPKFYEENKQRIEYALYQLVEDTKNQKKKSRIEAKKSGKPVTNTIAGATAATVAVGGIAAATFPVAFPIVGAILGGAIMAANRKNKKSENSSSRASGGVCHAQWITEAFETSDGTEE